MSIGTLLLIATVVSAVATVWSQLLRSQTSPYLVTVYGGRGRLLAFGVLIWSGAVVLGVGTMGLLSFVIPGDIALALFFGVQAVALDICAYRVQYVRDERQHTVVLQHVRAR